MDHAELAVLLTPEALRLLDSLPEWRSSDDAVRRVAELRSAGHSPELVSAVLTQSRLRAQAAAKFGEFASGMLFTQAGLEQATRLPVAALHAGRFQKAGLTRVADLGCGIGADALALSALDVAVVAVERDPVTAAIASFNLAPWPDSQVRHGDAETADLTGVEGVWLDPARREGARRLKDAADWSPSLDTVFGLADRLPTGVKLGPGIDRDLIPSEAEAQWVSVDREVVELTLWFGPLARSGVRRAALVMSAHGTHEMTAEADSVDAETTGLGAYLYEPDGAVIRARLIGDLARTLGGGMLDPTIAYISADAATSTPFAQGFRVIADLPLDARTLSKELAARGIGRLEIKKRGVDIDPARFRTSLKLSGDAAGTLILTRVAGARRAILAERL